VVICVIHRLCIYCVFVPNSSDRTMNHLSLAVSYSAHNSRRARLSVHQTFGADRRTAAPPLLFRAQRERTPQPPPAQNRRVLSRRLRGGHRERSLPKRKKTRSNAFVFAYQNYTSLLVIFLTCSSVKVILKVTAMRGEVLPLGFCSKKRFEGRGRRRRGVLVREGGTVASTA